MISDVTLNPVGGAKDIVNVFIVYKINSYPSQLNWCTRVFGKDNGGYDKFVAFSTNSRNLGIPGATPDLFIMEHIEEEDWLEHIHQEQMLVN